MTNFTTKLMIAAATAVVAAGTATAQTLKAEIPFAFRVGDKMMAAGDYRLSELSKLSGAKVYSIVGAKDQTIAMPVGSHDPKKAWVEREKPVIAFSCSAGHCSLAGIWKSGGTPEYTFKLPKLGNNETAQLIVIDLQNAKGD